MTVTFYLLLPYNSTEGILAQNNLNFMLVVNADRESPMTSQTKNLGFVSIHCLSFQNLFGEGP